MPSAQSGNPITIGFAMSLTGPLAANGKQALLGMKIWEEEINAKGGLLGRPVKLVYYDDQTNPSTVPGIYTKLLDVDKVDLVVGPYATNMAAPAMPVIMQKGKVFIILFGLAVNTEFKYPKVLRHDPVGSRSEALVHARLLRDRGGAEPEADRPSRWSRPTPSSPTTPARARAPTRRSSASRSSMTAAIRRRPPISRRSCARSRRPIRTSWRSARIRSNSVGMVRAVNELNYKPKMIGGAMVGLQATVFKNQLGPLLNGWVNYETWVPAKSMTFEGTEEFFKKYQSRAQAAGVDPLGYYLGGWGHAYISVLGDAIKATNSLDDNKLAEHIKPRPTFKTIHGNIKFGAGRRMGEVGHAAGAVSRHQAGRRHRGVARHGSPDRADAGRVQDRHDHLSVREGEVSG